MRKRDMTGDSLGSPVAHEPATNQVRHGWYESLIWPRIALIAWFVALVVITIMVAAKPLFRTVTTLYHDSVDHWHAGESLYQGPSGMNYFPQFSLLFAPFHELGSPLGDIAWRWISAAVLLWGVWRMVVVTFGKSATLAFSWVALLSLPLALGAIRSGQANAIFAGALLLATASIASREWWRACLWLLLGVCLKPLGLVALLLAPFVYKPLRWRLAEALLIAALLPLLFAPLDYILWMQGAAVSNLRSCSAVIENRFADFHGIIRSFGGELDPTVAVALRAVAAGATLVAWIIGSRKLDESSRALWLLTLTSVYLMLFNPMNESNSYVILAPVMAIWAVKFFADDSTRSLGWVLIAIVLSMGLLKEPLRPLFGNQFALVWHPLMTMVMFVITLRVVWMGDCTTNLRSSMATRSETAQ